jgi:hypothetical protein
LLIPRFSFFHSSGFSTIFAMEAAMLFLEMANPFSGSPFVSLPLHVFDKFLNGVHCDYSKASLPIREIN